MYVKYTIKQFGEVKGAELCSVDPDYTVSSLAALISGHDLGVLDIENECWFGHKDDYRFAPKNAPVLVKVL